MHKIIGVILLVLGIYLLLRGHDVSRSLASQFRHLTNGSASARETYYFLGGALACAVGLVEFFRSGKK
jgi:uncharacterized membrane protein